MNALAESLFVLPELQKAIEQCVAYTADEIAYLQSLYDSFSVYRAANLNPPSLGQIVTIPFPGVLTNSRKSFDKLLGEYSPPFRYISFRREKLSIGYRV